MENRQSVIVVTGASSGIGNACATLLAKKGNRVYGTCRAPSAYKKMADEFFELVPLELTDNSSIVKAAEKIFAADGRVDALVCCAGEGLAGSVEDVGLEDAERAMNVNFFGTLRTIKAFLPQMREAGKGRIVILTGIEGQVAAPYQGIYSACGHALVGLAESLRMEVSSFGVEVGLIEIGSFRTAFGQHRRIVSPASGGDRYKQDFENAIGVVSRDEADGLDPFVAARIIQSMLGARRMPIRRVAGRSSRRLLAFSKRLLGPYTFGRCVRSYYNLD